MFSVSLVYVLQWAAAKAVTVGEFVYEQASTEFTLGGEHGAMMGGKHGGTLGDAGITVVKEINE